MRNVRLAKLLFDMGEFSTMHVKRSCTETCESKASTHEVHFPPVGNTGGPTPNGVLETSEKSSKRIYSQRAK
jgi:hypothetical protein